MKITAATSQLETNGLDLNQLVAARVQITNSTFELLSTNIYTDPIRAVVRELSANAWDAHVEANNQHTPFEIHAPSELEPTFVIKDYGIGIAPELLQTRLTTYTYSTKQNTNDLIGALGLGCKSPLAVTDQYIVISRYNGIEHQLLVIKDEDGVPKSMITQVQETCEPNGIEYKIPVQFADIDKWRYAIRTVLASFSPLPNTHRLSVEPLSYAWKSKHGGFKTSNNIPSLSNFSALMGNIRYPIDKDILSESFHTITKQLNFKLAPIDLFFDIGEIEPNASREGLKYNQRTIKAIYEKTIAFIDEIKQDADKLNNIPNDIDKILATHALFKKHGAHYAYAITKFLTIDKTTCNVFYPDLFRSKACIVLPQEINICCITQKIVKRHKTRYAVTEPFIPAYAKEAKIYELQYDQPRFIWQPKQNKAQFLRRLKTNPTLIDTYLLTGNIEHCKKAIANITDKPLEILEPDERKLQLVTAQEKTYQIHATTAYTGLTLHTSRMLLTCTIDELKRGRFYIYHEDLTYQTAELFVAIKELAPVTHINEPIYIIRNNTPKGVEKAIRENATDILTWLKIRALEIYDTYTPTMTTTIVQSIMSYDDQHLMTFLINNAAEIIEYLATKHQHKALEELTKNLIDLPKSPPHHYTNLCKAIDKEPKQKDHSQLINLFNTVKEDLDVLKKFIKTTSHYARNDLNHDTTKYFFDLALKLAAMKEETN